MSVCEHPSSAKLCAGDGDGGAGSLLASRYGGAEWCLRCAAASDGGREGERAGDGCHETRSRLPTNNMVNYSSLANAPRQLATPCVQMWHERLRSCSAGPSLGCNFRNLDLGT